MIREGREVRSQTDYILGMDIRHFGNVSVRNPRHNSDHYMFLGCLQSAPLRDNSRYLWGRKRIPLRPPISPTREDRIFMALRRAVPKPLARYARKNMWILAEMWILVDERDSMRQDLANYQALIRRLRRAI